MLSAAGADASALVAGTTLNTENHTMKMLTVRVMRPFYYQGKPQPVDELLEVPGAFATELIAAQKAELFEAEEDGDQNAG